MRSGRVAKQAIASQLAAVMREQRISKVEMTKRSQLDRLLDPTYDGVTLAMLCRAARAVGREVTIKLQDPDSDVNRMDALCLSHRIYLGAAITMSNAQRDRRRRRDAARAQLLSRVRRFDIVMSFAMPSDEDIKRIVQSGLRAYKTGRLSWAKIATTAQGLSQAEITKATDEAVKSAILDERDTITTDQLVSRLKECHTMQRLFSSRITK